MKRVLFWMAVAGWALQGSLLAQSAEALKVERRSHFNSKVVSRNPFVPIGWVKPEVRSASVPEGTPQPTAAPPRSLAFFKPERFAVTSISLGAFPLAMINGKAYGEGDLIALPEAEGSIQVFAIRDGQVVLRYQGETIICPLREAGKGTPRGGARR